MIDWVFFDVGNVLFNDDRQSFFAYRFLHKRIQHLHPDYSFERLLAERETQARQGAAWILHRIARQFLTEEQVRDLFVGMRAHLIPSYDEHHLPNEGVFEVLEVLRGMYRLGVVANQPPECRSSLARRGLLDLFEVVAISEELDLHKPDARIYEWALDRAGCKASRAVMVGDRIDNDIAPAKRLSMWTILLRWPDSSYKNWRPDDPLARSFLKSCNAAPIFSRAGGQSEPDRVVETFADVPAAVESIVSQAADTHD